MVFETQEMQQATLDGVKQDYVDMDTFVNWTDDLVEACMVPGTSPFQMRKLVKLHRNPGRVANMKQENWGMW